MRSHPHQPSTGSGVKGQGASRKVCLRGLASAFAPEYRPERGDLLLNPARRTDEEGLPNQATLGVGSEVGIAEGLTFSPFIPGCQGFCCLTSPETVDFLDGKEAFQ